MYVFNLNRGRRARRGRVPIRVLSKIPTTLTIKILIEFFIYYFHSCVFLNKR